MVTVQVNLSALVIILLAARILYSEFKKPIDESNAVDFIWLLGSLFSICYSLGGVLP